MHSPFHCFNLRLEVNDDSVHFLNLSDGGQNSPFKPSNRESKTFHVYPLN